MNKFYSFFFLMIVLSFIILKVKPQSSSVNFVEKLSLDVVPCLPGYYCDSDGSIIEPCPEGSQHIVATSDEMTSLIGHTDEFAICASSLASSSHERALIPDTNDMYSYEYEGLDIAFSIELLESHEPEVFASIGGNESSAPLFWKNLIEEIGEDSNVIDVSYQEYIALDVNLTLCIQGHYCILQEMFPCPLSTYNPFEGVSACFTCPTNFSTVEKGSTDFQNCTISTKDRWIGQWIPIYPPFDAFLNDSLELEPQLAAYYNVSVESIVWIS